MFIFPLAGCKYRPVEAQAEVLTSPRGTTFILRRDPSNIHDANAIEVLSERTNMCLGFVPRFANKIIAPLMDAGRELVCRLRHTGGKTPMLAAGTSEEADELAPPEERTLRSALEASLDDEIPF